MNKSENKFGFLVKRQICLPALVTKLHTVDRIMFIWLIPDAQMSSYSGADNGNSTFAGWLSIRRIRITENAMKTFLTGRYQTIRPLLLCFGMKEILFQTHTCTQEIPAHIQVNLFVKKKSIHKGGFFRVFVQFFLTMGLTKIIKNVFSLQTLAT